MTAQYYRNQDAFILAYDCMRPKTFQSLQNWLDDVKENANTKNYVVAMTGAKADIDRDEVDKLQIRDFFE
eukprot:CAMPEP_0114587400 /NCGR_PEP_ID=MMETSP0125-20121206/10360_1 /TAXON_ID=485358 ORGANISM="Aristerostoma sp., Strain ATCC 50986" /NCGR_SAMPLE_ID=MMETSP0125 /ASSEMBLY_ACC=CAM_ASM_000245 /LENGTH=69 /DNA_ID=CAMNT_0001783273 /DNA_START=348 /DNA_END=557 /DNA_ORIENTATION=+